MWNKDISQVPKGEHTSKMVENPKTKKISLEEIFIPENVWLATKCGRVILSQWLPNQERLNMLAKGEEPLAWHEFYKPDYPEGI